MRLSFAPGEAAQVDFGAGPVLCHPDGRDRRTWAFVMTLAHSRHQYVEFVWDQTVATWLGCHRRALEWFGAVPGRIIVDNAKCAIIKACSHDPLVQRAYAECAEGYGFRIEACPPHDPQKKGIVESGVKYLKANFLPTRRFRDLADLNAQARAWVMNEAGRRDHGTTRQRPLALFELERALMQPLPAVAPDLGSWHRVSVHRDCHVQFDRGLYSVPFALVGKVLWLRATDGTVALFEDYRHIHTHARGQRPGERRTVADHMPPQARSFFAHDRHWCVQQAGKVGPRCVELIETLLSDRISERLRAAQGVLQLGSRFGRERLEAACARALDHGSPHYRTVKTILATGADQPPSLNSPRSSSNCACRASSIRSKPATAKLLTASWPTPSSSPCSSATRSPGARTRSSPCGCAARSSAPTRPWSSSTSIGCPSSTASSCTTWPAAVTCRRRPRCSSSAPAAWANSTWLRPSGTAPCARVWTSCSPPAPA